MYLRLRQICLVARELEPVVSALTSVFDLSIAIRDPNVAKHGLVNAVMPLGNTFLEVVAPIRAGTTAGRYLDRLGGDGGYMVILDCDDLPARESHLDSVGVRIAYVASYPEDGYRALHLHPKDVGATLLSIDTQRDGADLDGPWHPAGPEWQRHACSTRVGCIRALDLQSPEPTALAHRWSQVLQRPLRSAGPNDTALDLDNAVLRFVPEKNARGETMCALDIAVTDRAAVTDAAAAVGVLDTTGHLRICGLHMRMVE